MQGVGEYQNIETHPDHPEMQIVTFKDRSTAENFMYGAKDIPNVGKLDLGWYNASLVPSSQTNIKQAGADGDVGMGGTNGENGEASKGPTLEDYDIAEDYDVADDIS